MPDHDAFAKRGRALEEDYFRRKDRELIEKIRQAAATEQVRKDLGRQAGLDDPQLLQELHDLGFTPDTVGLLPLVPIIQMAWAEGGITKAERELILRLARSRGGRGGERRRSPADGVDNQPTSGSRVRPRQAPHSRDARCRLHTNGGSEGKRPGQVL